MPNVPAGLLTHGGTFVPQGETGPVPSLDDIVLSLSRMPRFGGHCRRPWSVLQHSLFVHQLMRDGCASRLTSHWATLGLRLSALLHDAHEAVTADIPTHFKAGDQRLIQQQLDYRIWSRFHPGGGLAHDKDAYRVHEADAAALLAEALLVGPPALQSPEDVEEFFGAEPDPKAVRTLERFLANPLHHDPLALQQLFLAYCDQCGVLP